MCGKLVPLSVLLINNDSEKRKEQDNGYNRSGILFGHLQFATVNLDSE